MQEVPVITQTDVTAFTPSTDPHSGDTCVDITLTEKGRRCLEEVSRQNVGNNLGIIIDGRIYSTPVIKGVISGNRVKISCSVAEREGVTNGWISLKLMDVNDALFSRIGANLFGNDQGIDDLRVALKQHRDDPKWSDVDRKNVQTAIDVVDGMQPIVFKDGTLTLKDKDKEGRSIYERKSNDLLALDSSEIKRIAIEATDRLLHDDKWGSIFRTASAVAFGTPSNAAQ